MAPLIAKFLTALLFALAPLSATAADATTTTTSTSCSTFTVTTTVPPTGSYTPSAVTAGATPMADMMGVPAVLGVAAVAAALVH
ncbi:hypothetical protein PG984_007867 [Apiospora sp. TS-2023a]